MPYFSFVCSLQETETSRKAPGVLILSEAVSCSPALRGTITVNPWKVESVAEAMAAALGATDADRVAGHQVQQATRMMNWKYDVIFAAAVSAAC